MRPLDVKQLVEQQKGAIARRQLLAGGLSSSAVARRIRAGRLVIVFPGVYAVGHSTLTPAGRRFAAVLACGEGAVASHRTAAEAWGLVASSGARWEITIPRAGPCAPASAIRVYRRPGLLAEERTIVDGLPVTTLARTLLDLAAVLRPSRLRRAVEQAEALGHFDLAEVDAVLEARAGRPGTPALRALLADAAAHDLASTRSELEARFLQLCLDAHLPRPAVNRITEGTEVDFTWAAQRLRVEVDGWRWHRSRRAFVDDRVRDRCATLAGYRTLRYTYDEVARRPASVIAELRTALLDG